MDTEPFISTENVDFIPANPNNSSHGKFLTNLLRDKNVKQHLSYSNRPLSGEVLFERYMDKSGELFLLAVDSDFIGFVLLFEIDSQNKHAEVGVAISPEFRGNGYSREAIHGITDYAFNYLDMHVLTAKIREDNEISKKLFDSMGFSNHGEIKERLVQYGERYDVNIYQITESEYREMNPR